MTEVTHGAKTVRRSHWKLIHVSSRYITITGHGAWCAGQAILRYTRIWHRRPDGWRLVVGHKAVSKLWRNRIQPRRISESIRSTN